MVLTDPHHSRADARLAARIIALGCVSEATASKLLRRAFVLAARSKKARDYAAAMSVPLAAARLELEYVKLNNPLAMPEPAINVNVGVQVNNDIKHAVELTNDIIDARLLRIAAARKEAAIPGVPERNGSSGNGPVCPDDAEPPANGPVNPADVE